MKDPFLWADLDSIFLNTSIFLPHSNHNLTNLIHNPWLGKLVKNTIGRLNIYASHRPAYPP